MPPANTKADGLALPPAVLTAIRDAARDNEIDPSLLVALAWRESRFNPQARNHRSSADGLLQFTSGAWLRAVHDFGAESGAGGYAAAIHKEPSSGLAVRGRHLRSAS